MQRGLAECMDSLRLCRMENTGIREVVPTMLLSLSRLQEAYDFIKWYATVDVDRTHEWGNPEAPFLPVKNAIITKSIACFEKETSCFFLAALAYIKFTLATLVFVSLRGTRGPNDVIPDHVMADVVDAFGSDLQLPRVASELLLLLEPLRKQANDAFKLVHKRNPTYWKYMLDPNPHLAEPAPPSYAPGSRYQVKV